MASTAKNSSDQNIVSTRQNIGFQRNPLFRLVETDFLASGNVFFRAESLLQMETVTDVSGGQFLKKGHILTNEN